METFIHLDLIKHRFIARELSSYASYAPLSYAASRNPYRQVVLTDWMAVVEPC